VYQKLTPRSLFLQYPLIYTTNSESTGDVAVHAMKAYEEVEV